MNLQVVSLQFLRFLSNVVNVVETTVETSIDFTATLKSGDALVQVDITSNNTPPISTGLVSKYT